MRDPASGRTIVPRNLSCQPSRNLGSDIYILFASFSPLIEELEGPVVDADGVHLQEELRSRRSGAKDLRHCDVDSHNCSMGGTITQPSWFEI